MARKREKCNSIQCTLLFSLLLPQIQLTYARAGTRRRTPKHPNIFLNEYLNYFQLTKKHAKNSFWTKNIFANKFPLTCQFRSPPRNDKPDYERWKSYQFEMDGHRVDLQTNVLRCSPNNYEFANRFAAEHPEMLMMSTWRAASGNPEGLDAEGNGDPLGESVIDFPGHFVLSPGSYFSSSLSNTGTSFTVEDGSKLTIGPALIVEEDKASGEKIWDRFEYVLINEVSGNRINNVEREFNGSPSARSFTVGSASTRIYVANMPWDTRVNTDYTDWFFNYSRDCPVNPVTNEKAIDVILTQMIDVMKNDGPLSNVGGLDLASGPLSIAPENADYNVDGLLDDDSKYWEGVDDFYLSIWEVLGENRVLTSELNFQMTSHINGPNLEGLAKPNDPWEEVSVTVNNILAWKVLSDRPFVALAFVQYLSNAEDKIRVNLHRLLNGYSTCLGVAADVDIGDGIEILERDELFKGQDRLPHWLGKPTSPLIRPALQSPNILISQRSVVSNNDWNLMWSNLDILRASLSIDGGELLITPNGQGNGFPTFYLYFQIAEKTDITIYMEAKSEGDELTRQILLPRIDVATDTGPVRAQLTNKDYLPIAWFLRGVRPKNSGNGFIQFDMRFKGDGPIRIRTLSVHIQTDVLACAFEKGVVVVNPSLEDVTMNLNDIFPARTGYRRLKASNVPIANIENKYHDQYDFAMALNDGTLIQNPTNVLIGERNALFLNADPIIAFNTPTSAPSKNPAPISTPTSEPTIKPTIKPAIKPTTTSEPSIKPTTISDFVCSSNLVFALICNIISTVNALFLSFACVYLGC